MIFSAGLSAQAQAQQAPAADGGDLKLETVVVSANRRIEKLEDVPASITVLGEEDIKRNNVREFVDIVNLSPALSISVGTQVGTNSINMRGIGTTSNNLGIEGDIAVIVDDLPYAQAQQAFKDMSDVSRVEVLKGPQSTLFGKSAIAGAVVITTKPIGSGPMQGRVSLFNTSDHEYRVATSLSGRLSDDVGLRLFASKTNFPGLLHNLTNDSMQNGSGGRSFIAKLQWKINNDLDVLISPHFDHSLSTGNTAAITSIGPGVGYLYNKNYTALSNTEVLRGIHVSPFNREIRNDSPSGLESTDRGIGLRINYAFPEGSPLAGHVLTSISSVDNNLSNDFRDNDNIDLISTYYQVDASGKPSGIAAKAEINGTTDSKTSTQELRLVSPDDGPFRYLAGLWIARNSVDRGYYRGNPFVKETSFTNYYTTSSALNHAIYGNANWDFAPKQSLSAGLRFNRETNDYMFNTIDSLLSSAPNNIHTGYNYYDAPQHKENATTGKLAYSYHFTPDVMAYGSASTGSKGVAYDMTSGANNTNVFAHLPLAQEKATSFELGFKANLWNNRATLNAAVYQTRFRDYQTSATERFSDGSQASVLYSIPALQTRGFEIDGTALLTRALMVKSSVAYTRATILDWNQGPCYSGATDCNVPNVLVPGAFVRDASGGSMPNAAKWKMTLGGEYTMPLGSLPYVAAINMQMRAQTPVTGAISQDPSLNRPGYGIVDLGASLSDNKGKYKLSVGFKNLFDHHYASGNIGSFLNFKQTSGPDIKSYGWQPARDAFRYATIRLDVAF
ncbi:TonB-dependent receptor [Duganella sp. SAP-35]|uniref:TonB-dependent receptor n=2 Tax=Duganella aceris TaxID=2703883 RepID=A0ABX0FPK6_9BURK|nr:TonB-dependent receptor [Duganella aceris]